MSTNEEIATTLEAAADALWIYGRCIGVGQADDGSMCVRGAIQHAQGNNPADTMCIFNAAVETFERYLFAHPELLKPEHRRDWPLTGRMPAWCWSDNTKDDAFVIDTLKACAKALRNGELEVV